ncbi:hypothetical protein BDW67DRAFT_189430 [Aspergillus spinulosporus]
MVQSESRQAKLLQSYHRKELIVGAGHRGLLFAVRLIETGFFMRMICSWWTRPQDSEAPSTGTGIQGSCATPKATFICLFWRRLGICLTKKYASGAEIRAYAERIARRWGLVERAMFWTVVQELQWDEGKHVWKVSALKAHGNMCDHKTTIRLMADFAIIAPGVSASPRIPAFPATQEFNGRLFHTVTWDYSFTGGTPDSSALTGLRDKKVAII